MTVTQHQQVKVIFLTLVTMRNHMKSTRNQSDQSWASDGKMAAVCVLPPAPPASIT